MTVQHSDQEYCVQLCEQRSDLDDSWSQFQHSRNSPNHVVGSYVSIAEAAKFYDIEDLIADWGDIAIVIEEHHYTPGHYYICIFEPFDSSLLSDRDLSFAYLSTCNPFITKTDFLQIGYLPLDSLTLVCLARSASRSPPAGLWARFLGGHTHSTEVSATRRGFTWLTWWCWCQLAWYHWSLQ